MGFFDDLGKKVADAGQKTMQKTKELSEVARINSQISQAENKMNNLHYQIGKLYISMHGQNPEEEFKGMIDSIAELEQQIIAYRAQIQTVKGVQKCEKCGAEVPRNVAFCSSCGAAMPKAETPAAVNPADCVPCPGCGMMVAKGMRFCTSCGCAMPAAAPEPAAPMTAVNDFAENSAPKVCPNCGAALAEDSAFCMECGNKI